MILNLPTSELDVIFISKTTEVVILYVHLVLPSVLASITFIELHEPSSIPLVLSTFFLINQAVANDPSSLSQK